MSYSFKTLSLRNLILAIIVAVCAIPVRAETNVLAAGKYASSAAFPCTSQQQEPRTYKTDVGNVSQTSSMCSQGDTAYTLTITEFPKQLLAGLSTNEMLDSTLDDARSKSYMKIVSSNQTRYQNHPAIRAHLLDTRKPETESFTVSIFVDRYLISALVVAATGQGKPKSTSDFLDSVKINVRRK